MRDVPAEETGRSGGVLMYLRKGICVVGYNHDKFM